MIGATSVVREEVSTTLEMIVMCHLYSARFLITSLSIPQ